MSSVVLREVGGLHEGIGGEEASDDGVVEAGVGVDDMQSVVVLVSSEAAVKGERGLGLRSVPGGVAHAVAPGVEVGALDGVLVLVQNLLPAAQMVSKHVVETLRPVLVDADGHNAAFGVYVVQPS